MRSTEAVDVEIATLDPSEVEQINALIAEGTRALARDRGGRPVLGMPGVLAQDVFDAPAAPKRSPMPLCHASCADAFRAYRDGWREWVRAFREASATFRRGVLDVVFPEHAFRPWVPILRT